MLRWRLTVAMLIIAPTLGLLLADYHWNFGLPGIWLVPLLPLIAAAAAAELLSMLRAKQLQPCGWTVHAGTQAVMLGALAPIVMPPDSAWWPVFLQGPFECAMTGLMAAAAMAFTAELIRFRQPGSSVVQLALGVLIPAYIALPMVYFVQLRLYRDNGWGMVAMVSLMAIVKFSDTGAYFCGRLWGRHKMTPVLSPKKTIEGAAGGLVTAAVVAWLLLHGLAPAIVGPAARETSVAACLVFGFIVGAAAMLGDLAESLIKRDLERKDSSQWMPGLGGVLDILDSVLFAAPAAYFCWACGLIGPGALSGP